MFITLTTAEGQTAGTDSKEAEKIRRPSLVVVSKRQKSDRPLRSNPDNNNKPPPAAEEDDDVVASDYRLTFGGRQQKADSFSRSISHPGPPPSVAEIIIAGVKVINFLNRFVAILTVFC